MFIHGWSSLGLTVMDMDIRMPDAGSVNTEMHTNGFNRLVNTIMYANINILTENQFSKYLIDAVARAKWLRTTV